MLIELSSRTIMHRQRSSMWSMRPRSALAACEALLGNSHSIYRYLFIALNHSIRGLDYTVGHKELLLRQ